MAIEDREFGEFKGRTEAQIDAIHRRLKTIDESIKILNSRNGWRGSVRPGLIGGGGVAVIHTVIELLKVMP